METKTKKIQVTKTREFTEEETEKMVNEARELKIRNEARLKELTEIEATNKKSLSGGDLIELIILRGAKKIRR